MNNSGTISKLANHLNLVADSLGNVEDASEKARIALIVAQAYKELEYARDAKKKVSGGGTRRSFEVLIGVAIAVAAISGYFLTTLQPILIDIAKASERQAKIMEYDLGIVRRDLVTAQKEVDRREELLEKTRQELFAVNERHKTEVDERESQHKEEIEKLQAALTEARRSGDTKAIEVREGELKRVQSYLIKTQRERTEAKARSEDLLRDVRELDTGTPITEIELKTYQAGQPDQPRGIRNNNPVLVAKDRWVGLMPRSEMSPSQLNEDKFAVFIHPSYGFRAGARVLLRQQREAGKPIPILDQLYIWFGNTSAQKIAAKRIADSLDVEAHSPIDLTDRYNLKVFLTELAKFHNGVDPLPYGNAIINEGLTLAGLAPNGS